MPVNLDRLLSQLQPAKLQQTNNPLYQVIVQLIKAIQELQAAFDEFESDGGGGGVGPPGPAGSNGMVPYFIASDEEFEVPEFKQALFSMNIDNEGSLVIDGFLIEVD